MPNLLKYNFKSAVNPVFFCIIERARKAGISYRNPFEYGYFGYLDIVGQVNVHTGQVNLVRAHHILEGRKSLVESAAILFNMDRPTFLLSAIGKTTWTDDLNPTDAASEIIDTGGHSGVGITALDAMQQYPEKNIWYHELDQACKFLSGKEPTSDLIEMNLTRGGNDCMMYGEGYLDPNDQSLSHNDPLLRRFIFNVIILNKSATLEIRSVKFRNAHSLLHDDPIIGTDAQGNPITFFQLFQVGVTVDNTDSSVGTNFKVVSYENDKAFKGAPGSSIFGYEANILANSTNGGDNVYLPPVFSGGKVTITFSAGIYPHPFNDTSYELPNKRTVVPVVGLNINGDYIVDVTLNNQEDSIGFNGPGTITAVPKAAVTQSMDIVTQHAFCELGPGGGLPPGPPLPPPPRDQGGTVKIEVKVIDKVTGEEVDLTTLNRSDTAVFRIYTINSGVNAVTGTYTFNIVPTTGLTGTFSAIRPGTVAAPGRNEIDSESYPIGITYPLGSGSTLTGIFSYTASSGGTDTPISSSDTAGFNVVAVVTDPEVNTGQLIIPVSIPSVGTVSKPTAPPNTAIGTWLAAANNASAAANTGTTSTLAAQSASQQAKAASLTAVNAIQAYANTPTQATISAAVAAAGAAYAAVNVATTKIASTVVTLTEAHASAIAAFTKAGLAGASPQALSAAQALVDSIRIALDAAKAARDFANTAFNKTSAVPRTAAALAAGDSTNSVSLANIAYNAVVAMNDKMVLANSLAAQITAIALTANNFAVQAAGINEPPELAQYPHILNLTYNVKNTDLTIKIKVNDVRVNLVSPSGTDLNGMFKIVAVSSLSFDLAPNEAHDVVFSCAVLTSATYTGTVIMQGSASGTGSDGKSKAAPSVIDPGEFQLISSATAFSDTIQVKQLTGKLRLDNCDPATDLKGFFTRPSGNHIQASIQFTAKIHNNSENQECIVRTVNAKRKNNNNSIDASDVSVLIHPGELQELTTGEGTSGTQMIANWKSINYRNLVSETSDYLDWFWPPVADISIVGNVPEGPQVLAQSDTDLDYEYRIKDVGKLSNVLEVEAEVVFNNGNTDTKTNTAPLTPVKTLVLYEAIKPGTTTRVQMGAGKFRVTIYGAMLLFLDDTRPGAGFGKIAHWASEVQVRDQLTALFNPASPATTPAVGGYAGSNILSATEQAALDLCVGIDKKLEFNITNAMALSGLRTLEFTVSDRFTSTALRNTSIAVERLGEPVPAGPPLLVIELVTIRHFLFTRADGVTALPNNNNTINCQILVFIKNTGDSPAILRSVQMNPARSNAVVFPFGMTDDMRAQYLSSPNCINMNQGSDPNTFINGKQSVTLEYVFGQALNQTATFSLSYYDITSTTPANVIFSPATTVTVAQQSFPSTAPAIDTAKEKYRFGLFSDAFYPGQLKTRFLGTFISARSSATPPRAAWGAATHYNARTHNGGGFGYPMRIGDTVPDVASNSDREAFVLIRQQADSALIGYPPTLSTTLQQFNSSPEITLFSGDTLGPNRYGPAADLFLSPPNAVISDGRFSSVAHVVSQDKDLPLWCVVSSIVTSVTGSTSAWTMVTELTIGAVAYNKATGIPASPSAKGGLKYLRYQQPSNFISANITSPITKPPTSTSGGLLAWGDNAPNTKLCSLSNTSLNKIAVTTVSSGAFPNNIGAPLGYTYIEAPSVSLPPLAYMTGQNLTSGTNNLLLNRWLSSGGGTTIQILPAFNVPTPITISVQVSYISRNSTPPNNSDVVALKGNNTLLPAGPGCPAGPNAQVRIGALCFDSVAGFYGPTGPSTGNIGLQFPANTAGGVCTFSVSASSFGGLAIVINNQSIFKTL